MIKIKFIQENQTIVAAHFTKETWEKHFKGLTPDKFRDPILQREIFFLSVLGTAALEESKLSNVGLSFFFTCTCFLYFFDFQLTSLLTKMSNVYSTAKICPYKKQDCDLSKEGLSLDPGTFNFQIFLQHFSFSFSYINFQNTFFFLNLSALLVREELQNIYHNCLFVTEIEEVLSTSTDYDELEYIWSSWRNATGAKLRNDYKQYIDLSNEAARLNGYYSFTIYLQIQIADYLCYLSRLLFLHF